MIIINVGVHLKHEEDERIALEYVEAHDSNTTGYFRLRFGMDVTIYLSKAQRQKLSEILAQASEPPEPLLASEEEVQELRLDTQAQMEYDSQTW